MVIQAYPNSSQTVEAYHRPLYQLSFFNLLFDIMYTKKFNRFLKQL